MSGVKIIRYLLANDSSLTAQVPAERIRAGDLPKGITLPSVQISKVGDVQENNLAMNSSTYLVEERVQVTVFTKTYPQQKQIIDLVRKACPLSRGTINGVECEGVIPDSGGPDFEDQTQKTFGESQDFLVSFQRSAT